VETIAEVWRRRGSDAPRLRVIGDGPGRGALEAIGAEMLGAVPHADVPALLAEADIGLAPYAPDAPTYFSPLKLFEYLAAGLAVVAADIPGVSDIVPPDAAVLIRPGDATALAAGVTALANDADERSRLGRKAKALAGEHTWERRARRIIEAAAELSTSEVTAA
jgi:starch synthase